MQLLGVRLLRTTVAADFKRVRHLPKPRAGHCGGQPHIPNIHENGSQIG